MAKFAPHYFEDAFLQEETERPQLFCGCGACFIGQTWAEVGAMFDAHLKNVTEQGEPMSIRLDDKQLYNEMESWTPVYRFSERAPEECSLFFMEGALMTEARGRCLLRVHFQTEHEERYLVLTLDEARAMHDALTDCQKHLIATRPKRKLRYVE